MTQVFEPAAQARFVERVARLEPDTPARWGKFNAPKMLAHLNDSLRMAIGELDVAPRPGPLRNPVFRYIAVHVLPFPKGVPTAPELLARGDRAEFNGERAAFGGLIAKVGTRKDVVWPDHPAFGRMSRKDWGVLVYRHTDHHLRQFGV